MKNKSRWDSLSMRDRATLINMYTKGGYTNLDDIRNHYNSFGEGGPENKNVITPEHAKLLARRGMPGDYEALQAAGYDKFGRPLVTFGGGSFGGAGAGMPFDTSSSKEEQYDYIRNTPVLRSFSDAFSEARKKGLNKFSFNGKEYSTEMSDNPNYIGKRYEPKLNLREVLDENKNVISDSTRVEPYLGQIPGTHKRNKFEDGGNFVEKRKFPEQKSWKEAQMDTWYGNVYPNIIHGTVPYRSTYTNADLETKMSSKTTIPEFIEKMYPIVEQTMVSKGKDLKNVDNMMTQIAYESNYGRSPRGNGYNLAGIKEFNKTKPRTKHTDGQYYRDFENYGDFADYYTDLLLNRYGVENADNLKDYVGRLHGNNPEKLNYSTNKKYYNNMKSMRTFKKELDKYKK